MTLTMFKLETHELGAELTTGPLRRLVRWIGLVPAGLVAVVRLAAGKDRECEPIDPPLELGEPDDACVDETADV